MSGDELSPEELQQVLEELCLTRRLSADSQMPSQGNMEPGRTYNYSELEILMPRLSHRKGYNDFVKEKQTCTSEHQYERGTSASQSEYAQTQPVKCESKVSQTTFGSSLTIQTDMLGELREEILNPKKTISTATTCSDQMNLSNTASNMSGLIDQGSNTDTFYCWVHPHRSFSRNKHTRSRSHTVSKINVSESGRDMKRNKKEAGILKKAQEKNKAPHIGDESDFVSSKTIKKGAKDKFIEYNGICNVDVYQNIASWSQTPFTPAEKESKTTTFTLENLRNSSSNIKSMNSLCSDNPQWQQKDIQELGRRDEFVRALKNSNNSGVSKSSFEDRNCSQKNSWISNISPGLKGDIISNLDKCFRDLDTPAPGLRLTRSDSSMTVFRASNGEPRNNILQNCDKVSHKSSKIGKPTIYWAITKINIYPDNSRTYEVMPLTGKRPSEVPEKSDSVFVLIPPLKGVPKYK